MALSGSFTGTTANERITPKITWSATQSVSGNYSDVTATLTYSRNNTGYVTEGNWSGSITINGVKFSESKRISITYNSNTQAITNTVRVYHNADGTKSITISASGAINGSTLTSTSISKSIALDTIPRASSVTATSAYIEENTTIKITRASSSFTHTLTYSFEGLTGTIATKTTSTSVSWEVPTSFYEKIPNAKSGTCTITCETFNGSTSLGKKTCTFTASVKHGYAMPILNMQAYDTDEKTLALTGNKDRIIKGFNKVYVSSGATARAGTTLKSQEITDGNKTITTATGNFTNTESNEFTFSVTDNRGFSNTKTLTKTLVNYVKLTCTLAANNPDTNGNMSFTVSGNYFNGTFGAVDNTLTVQYRIKENSGSYGSWTALTATKSGNTYKVTKALTGLNYQSKYTLQARALDKIYDGSYKAAVVSATKTVRTTPLFDWGENDFQFNVPIIFPNSGLSVRGTTTDGVDVQAFAPCNENNNCVIGYGGYVEEVGATNIYGNDINLMTKADFSINDGTAYSILGAMKAMTNRYALTCTPTAGANYTSVSATANLIGNQLRLSMSATRNAAANEGDIVNEDIMTINVKHDGKIKSALAVGFGTATTGAPANFTSSDGTVVDSNNMTFTIRLCGVAVSDNAWNAHWVVPVVLNINAFV